MLGTVKKTDFEPREAAAGQCADYEHGAPENSGEPGGFIRQLVSQRDQKTGTSKSNEYDASAGSSQKPW